MSIKPLLPAVLLLCAATTAHAQTDASKPTDTTTVTVSGKKKPVSKKPGKTVYDAADNPKSDSGTAQDVLQSTPTISVSPNGDLAVKGNGNVTVLINGKPSAVMSGENRAVALQTMSGSDIASVEVITNPSAAYAANGGAIVNIVLKKSRKPGAHGSLRANASDQGLWSVNASGDYTKGKLSLHASAGIRRDGTLKFRRSGLDWRDPLSATHGQTLQSSEVFIRRWTQSATLGLDYDLSNTDSVSAAATYNFRRSRPLFDEAHQDYLNDALSRAYHRVSNGPNQQADDTFTLGYTHQDDDTLLKAALQHSDTMTLVDKSFVNIASYPAPVSTWGRVLNKAGRRLDEASLDVAHPFGTIELSAGLDFQRDANTLNTYFADLDPLTGHQTVDPATTHRYQVIETLSAAYVTAQMTLAERWQILAGLRQEALTTRITAGTSPAITGAGYRSLNPSLHLKYVLTPTQSLGLSYRQSLQRPDPRDLDPFVTYGDAQSLSIGNPALKPQGVKSLELSWDVDAPKLTRSLGAFYRRSRQTVVETRTLIPGNILLTTRENAGSGRSTGLTAAIDWRPSDAFHLSSDASLYSIDLTSVDLGQPVRQSMVSASGNLSLGWTRGADDLSVDAHLLGPGLTPQGTLSGTSALNLTWKHRLSPRLSATLSASDIFDGAKQGYTTTTSTFSQRGYNHFVARRIYLGLVYKIG